MASQRGADADVIVVGAGAAGMMAAAVAGQRGLRVLLVDHAERLGEKIRISGGGRCNFTNLGTQPDCFVSRNPDFSRSALAGYTPQDFLALLRRHRVSWHEKHRGQLFCDDSSQRIIDLLRAECDGAGVRWRMPCAVREVAVDDRADGPLYRLSTDAGTLSAPALVLATGGLAIPAMGATDFALRVARQFGLKIVEPRPALVPLLFDAAAWRPFAALAGVSVPVRIAAAGQPARGRRGRGPVSFDEDLLFTHRGLSGPAVLQVSSYWEPGRAIDMDLSPGQAVAAWLREQRAGNRQQLDTVLAGLWPQRLAAAWLAAALPHEPGLSSRRLADLPDRLLDTLADRVHHWALVPTGTAGYKKAEVMRGGVDTAELDQRSLQAKRRPGLYVIGEAVDITGWLGGYNFQWAWASGVACGRALDTAR